jgi:thiol-disulfide isomerase/thioredoxin
MFKKSLFLAISILLLVFGSALAGQLWITNSLPSRFDNGVGIGQAMKTSKVPLLVEFYSDTCGSCQRVAPWIHTLSESTFKDRLTPVMLNVDDPEVMSIAKLFGVQNLPAVFVFDTHHGRMKKYPITPEQMVSETELKKSLETVVRQLNG